MQWYVSNIYWKGNIAWPMIMMQSEKKLFKMLIICPWKAVKENKVVNTMSVISQDAILWCIIIPHCLTEYTISHVLSKQWWRQFYFPQRKSHQVMYNVSNKPKCAYNSVISLQGSEGYFQNLVTHIILRISISPITMYLSKWSCKWVGSAVNMPRDFN